MCPFCHADLSAVTAVFRSSTCPSCGNDLKICRNCRFYAPSAHWECSETIGERVADKDRANFCEFFRFAPGSGGVDNLDKKKAALDAFGSLFKD